LDELAEKSGDDQEQHLGWLLAEHEEPSLVTLALLDDENIGLGTSQMRDAFFDGTRDERKHREAFVEYTTTFIKLAQKNALPTRPTIGEPFDPMLAVSESRGTPNNPIAQTKLDGYRILIHVKQEEIGPKAYAFTRRLNDVTKSLPELNEIDWPETGEYILDGEVIAETGSYSDTSSRVGRDAENVNRDVAMEFAIFDCIVLDGLDVWDMSYIKRWNYARDTVESLSDSIYVLDWTDDIERAKDEAVANGDEGIIVKDKTAPYEFGKRSAYWQKQKMDSDNLDLKICGFHEGDGEGSNTLGAVEIETSDGVHLGRSGSGFTDEKRKEIWNNQDEWMGRTIEIEARGLGSNSNLRMPIFVRDRKADGTADSWSRVKELMKDV
jgi:ATP-dependent DNA ligase